MHDPRDREKTEATEGTSEELPATRSFELPTNVEPIAPEGSDEAPDTTSFVPSYHQPAAEAPSKAAPGFPAAGETLDDFELLAVLGKGAFATVYLARQISLGRQVAQKVSANRGREAQTLASLEHDHIVRVFSESVLPERNLRLLCMQYVNGATLEQVLKALSMRPRENWHGQAILEIIDMLASQPALFDPAALRDRELLGQCDYVEAVCWIMARIGEALAHAHSQGVLHRDIKPANILINRYGRPMLADFNVALDPDRIQGARGEVFGGTLAYMSPEHLDAFNPSKPTTPEAVDELSDVYSLGIVLFETVTCRLPFATHHKGGQLEVLNKLAEERKNPPPSLPHKYGVPEMLDWVTRRCLDPEPEGRFENAEALAEALEGCREHHEVVRELPRPGVLTRNLLRHPFSLGIVLVLLPHLLGSIVNISYNAIRIMGDLTARQQEVFNALVLYYNVLVYPVCLYVFYRIIVPIYRTWRALDGPAVPNEEEVQVARGKVMRLPYWAIGLACAGWLPGGVLFPIVINAVAGPLEPHVFSHFVISFSISGLIALTYSLFAMQYWGLRVLYPRLWVDAHHLREQAAAELVALQRRLNIFQTLAG
ncbi:MAG: serine/threonine-protein kinase, partial [Gemmataceae bacterium]